MKKILTTAILALAIAMTATAKILPDNLNYTVRLGWNVGGTTPIGMPATIRKMNSYKLQSNLLLGFDIQKDFNERWGLMTGLHFESKGMKVDATVKNYHMTIVRGGETLTGYFTGNNVSDADMQMATIPVLATCRLGDKVLMKFGPYISYLTTHNFEGYVYNGYLRKDTPTGQKIEMSDDEESRATYDFSGDMRRFQWGLDLGVDWNIYHRWGVYADLSWGLSGIYNSEFDTIEQTLYPIYGSIGLTYKLK